MRDNAKGGALTEVTFYILLSLYTPKHGYAVIQPNASLTMIGLSAPTSTVVGILLNIGFFLWLKRYENQTSA